MFWPSIQVTVALSKAIDGSFCWELVPYDFPLIVLHTENQHSLSTCGVCSEVVSEFE